VVSSDKDKGKVLLSEEAEEEDEEDWRRSRLWGWVDASVVRKKRVVRRYVSILRCGRSVVVRAINYYRLASSNSDERKDTEMSE
jgi:hypothetical protein